MERLAPPWTSRGSEGCQVQTHCGRRSGWRPSVCLGKAFNGDQRKSRQEITPAGGGVSLTDRTIEKVPGWGKGTPSRHAGMTAVQDVTPTRDHARPMKSPRLSDTEGNRAGGRGP